MMISATTYWKAYMAVKRMNILKNFRRIFEKGPYFEKGIYLEEPSLEHKNQFLEMMNEWKNEGGRINPAVLRKYDAGYEAWIDRINLYKSIDTCPKDRVPSDTYFVMQCEKLIGAISIRHYLASASLGEDKSFL